MVGARGGPCLDAARSRQRKRGAQGGKTSGSTPYALATPGMLPQHRPRLLSRTWSLPRGEGAGFGISIFASQDVRSYLAAGRAGRL